MTRKCTLDKHNVTAMAHVAHEQRAQEQESQCDSNVVELSSLYLREKNVIFSQFTMSHYSYYKNTHTAFYEFWNIKVNNSAAADVKKQIEIEIVIDNKLSQKYLKISGMSPRVSIVSKVFNYVCIISRYNTV